MKSKIVDSEDDFEIDDSLTIQLSESPNNKPNPDEDLEMAERIQKEALYIYHNRESDSLIKSLNRNIINSYYTDVFDDVVVKRFLTLVRLQYANFKMFMSIVFAFDGFFSGSSVLASSFKKVPYHSFHDIDVYIPASKKELFFAFVQKFWTPLTFVLKGDTRYFGGVHVRKTNKFVKFVDWIDSVYEATECDAIIPIQIIFYKDEVTPENIVKSFDISVCSKYIDKIGYNNLSPSHLSDNEFIMKCHGAHETYKDRLLKYIKRGFVFVEGHLGDPATEVVQVTRNVDEYLMWLTPEEESKVE